MTKQQTGQQQRVLGLRRACGRLAAAWVAATLPFVAGASADAPATAAAPAGAVQTECPMMVGNKIDPAIYVDYQGKRVFFCCQLCKTEFQKDPAKYLPRLPQFAGVAAPAAPAAQGHEDGPAWHVRLIAPMGALTLLLVAAAVVLALLRRVRWPRPGFLLKAHKVAGVAALVCAVVHATLVFLAD